MNFSLSSRALAVRPSPTLAVTALAASLRSQGKDIISLGVGEPDFDTPQHIKEAANKAIAAGKTKYTAVDGELLLKQAVIDKLQRDNQLSYEKDQVIVSSGCKQGIFNLVLALINPGDEVIIPAPYWVSYPDIVVLSGGQPKIVTADIEQHFKITPEQLEQALTPKTKLVFINSPSNPSGIAYTRKELKALGQVLLQYPEVIIASDDIYEHILWSDEAFSNIAMACPDLMERTVVLNGVSKAYAMTGWRIGYSAGPKWLIQGMKKIQSQSTSNPCSISQAAALEALNGPQDCILTMRNAFAARHEIVYKRLNQLPHVTAIPADGTFYIFPDISEVLKIKGMESDTELVTKILDSGVALVPGSAFGSPGHLRLSFALGDEKLAVALDRMETILGGN